MWGDIVRKAMKGMLVIGILIGMADAGLIWLAVWLWQHVTLGWIA